jgi:hypothetical protein
MIADARGLALHERPTGLSAGRSAPMPISTLPQGRCTWDRLGTLVAAAASAFVAGLLIIPLGRETRGKTLPE